MNRRVLILLVLATVVTAGCSRITTKIANIKKHHPQSELAPDPAPEIDNPVVWVWSGALTPTSIRVMAKLEHAPGQVRLLIDTEPGLPAPRAFAPRGLGAGAWHAADFEASGLSPSTRYRYAIEVDGGIDRVHTGSFRTPAVGPQSFTFAFGSCARTGSNGSVFDTIRAHDPLFFLHLGDFHYENIASNDVSRFLTAFDRVLTAPAQARLYRAVPTVYIYDDHDFGGNDSHGRTPGRPAAQRAYRLAVPHYDLAAGGEEAPIYQAFTIGRVRFVATDLRSERTPKTEPDDGRKTMLGARQKTWFFEELTRARDADQIVIWACTVPWIGEPDPQSDTWAGYHHERLEIARFLEDNAIPIAAIVSGDAHMLAIDDGSNNRYGPSGEPLCPVLHAAAFDRSGRLKGGPYSHGAYPGAGHFGLLTIEDDGGDTIRLVASGRDYQDREIVGLEWSIATPQPPDP